MGANRRNDYGMRWDVNIPRSRRFQVNHFLHKEDNGLYLVLLTNYQYTKQHCQEGKEGNDRHLESIKQLKDYLDKAQKEFKHS